MIFANLSKLASKKSNGMNRRQTVFCQSSSKQGLAALMFKNRIQCKDDSTSNYSIRSRIKLEPCRRRSSVISTSIVKKQKNK